MNTRKYHNAGGFEGFYLDIAKEKVEVRVSTFYPNPPLPSFLVVNLKKGTQAISDRLL